MKKLVKTDRNRLVVAIAMIAFAIASTAIVLAIHGWLIPVLNLLHYGVIAVGIVYLFGTAFAEINGQREGRKRGRTKIKDKNQNHASKSSPELPHIMIRKI